MGADRRIAIVFHYFEANASYRDNLIFFLAMAYRSEHDFYVVLSGECSVKLPELPNIRYIPAPNLNSDYGGYCAALDAIDDLEAYTYYIFVNSSVRGPFLYGSLGRGDWTDLFINLLDDDTGLVGSTICIMSDDHGIAWAHREIYADDLPLTHVQTTAYALPAAVLKHLWDIGFYAHRERMTKVEVVCRYEVRLTQEVIRAGRNIRCLQDEYNSVDYCLPHRDMNGTSHGGDPLFAGAFFGRTLHPREAVFIKTNRDLLNELELAAHTYAALRFSRSLLCSEWTEADDLMKRMEAKVPRNYASIEPRLTAREWKLIRAFRTLKSRCRSYSFR